MSTFYLEEATMLSKIEQLKAERAKIDTVLEKVKGDTLQIQDYWTGNSGETVQEQMNEYTNEFDYISSKLEKQITTLEEAVRKYNKANLVTSRKIDENSQVSAI